MRDQGKKIDLFDGEVTAWVEQGTSLHIKAVTEYGDPVELTFEQALALAHRLRELVLAAVSEENEVRLPSQSVVIPSPTDIDILSHRERYERLASLSEALTVHLKQATDFEVFAKTLIGDLREAGFDLWSFDYDDGRQIWCGDWTRPGGTKLIVTIDRDWGVDLSWSRPTQHSSQTSEPPIDGT